MPSLIPTAGRRPRIAGILLAGLVVLSGCSAVTSDDPLTFTATPASVCEDTLSETGYEPEVSRWRNATRTVEVAGNSQDVTVNSYVNAYVRRDGSERRGGFAVVSTPQGSVLGQPLNPVDRWSPERVVRELAGNLDQYGDLRDLRQAEQYEIEVLDKESSVTVFRATGTDQEGNATEVVVHVTKLRHGDDLLIAGGVYEATNEAERDRIERMLRCLDHAASSDSATTTPASGDLQAGDLPPGVARSGVVNASRLLAAHRANRPQKPYRTRLDPVGPVPTEDDSLRIVRGDSRLRVRHTGGDGTTRYWAATGERTVVAARNAGGVTYARGPTPVAGRLFGLSNQGQVALVPFIRFGSFETAGAVRNDGKRYVKLRASGLNTTALEASAWSIAGPNGTVEGISGSVLISPAGRITRAQFRVSIDTKRGRITDQFRYELGPSRSGRLARPAWIDDAPHVRVSLSETGAVLTLEVAGGRPIARGTELTLLGEREPLASVSVPQAIRPGSTLYVTLTREPGSITPTVRVHATDPGFDPQWLDLDRYDSITIVGQGANSTFQASL